MKRFVEIPESKSGGGEGKGVEFIEVPSKKESEVIC